MMTFASLAACQSQEEDDEIYGIYSWPLTSPGETAKINCAYNKHVSTQFVGSVGYSWLLIFCYFGVLHRMHLILKT